MDSTDTTPPRESGPEVANSRCTCCQPVSATSDQDEARALEARYAAVEQRLRQMTGSGAGSPEEVGA